MTSFARKLVNNAKNFNWKLDPPRLMSGATDVLQDYKRAVTIYGYRDGSAIELDSYDNTTVYSKYTKRQLRRGE